MAENWVEVPGAEALAEGFVRSFLVDGFPLAMARVGGKVYAVEDRCSHDDGPLGEGVILRGCITCPWHGYQYRPEDGCSPPPFTEKVPTFAVRMEGGEVLVHPQPHPPGTALEPARVGEGRDG